MIIPIIAMSPHSQSYTSAFFTAPETSTGRMLKGGIARDHTKTVHPGDELSLKDVQIRTFNSHDSDAYKRGHVPVYDR